jgi:hypothetical protein
MTRGSSVMVRSVRERPRERASALVDGQRVHLVPSRFKVFTDEAA